MTFAVIKNTSRPGAPVGTVVHVEDYDPERRYARIFAYRYKGDLWDIDLSVYGVLFGDGREPNGILITDLSPMVQALFGEECL